jgi:hypothetical protein
MKLQEFPSLTLKSPAFSTLLKDLATFVVEGYLCLGYYCV